MEERCTSLETSSPLECEVVKCCISGVTSASDTIYDYLQRDKQLYLLVLLKTISLTG